VETVVARVGGRVGRGLYAVAQPGLVDVAEREAARAKEFQG
jgi:hypothetical protein